MSIPDLLDNFLQESEEGHLDDTVDESKGSPEGIGAITTKNFPSDQGNKDRIYSVAPIKSNTVSIY